MLFPKLAFDPLPAEAAEGRKAFGGLRPNSSPCWYFRRHRLGEHP
jgi:hypothetical protein